MNTAQKKAALTKRGGTSKSGTGTKKRTRSSKRSTSIKKREKHSFLQDWGTYQNETIVTIGTTPNETLRYMKRITSNKEMIAAYKEKMPELAKLLLEGATGYFWHKDGRSVLWVKTWGNHWNEIETLVHELHHAVFTILQENKAMSTEMEALAYQQEYLLRQITRKLNKFFLE